MKFRGRKEWECTFPSERGRVNARASIFAGGVIGGEQPPSGVSSNQWLVIGFRQWRDPSAIGLVLLGHAVMSADLQENKEQEN